MPPKLIPPAIAIFSLLSAYYLFQTADALYTGAIAADKRYHQAEIFRSEDPALFFQILGFHAIGFLASAWVAIILFRQRRSKSSLLATETINMGIFRIQLLVKPPCPA